MQIVVSVIIAACWTMIAVQSFGPRLPPFFYIRLRARGWIRTDPAMVTTGMNANGDAGDLNILPRYGLGGADLSRRWIELVWGGHMLASATLSDDDGGDGGMTTTVQYRVRLEDGVTGRQGGGH